MREQYDLVLGRKEEIALRREILAATLGAWTAMVAGYVGMSIIMDMLVTSPTSGQSILLLVVLGLFLLMGFQIIKASLTTIFWYFSSDMSKSESRRCSVCARPLLRKMCHDILSVTLSFLLIYSLFLMCMMSQALSYPHDDDRVRSFPGSFYSTRNFID